MKRLDVFLTDEGLAPSRTKAKELIERGSVQVSSHRETKVVTQVSYKLKPNEQVYLLQDELLSYVSRSGLKLEKALLEKNLNVSGFQILDVGLSTGGFSDCVLQKGAKTVIGVDVGTAQVAEKLKTQKNLLVYEQTNARDLSLNQDFEKWLGQLDLIVGDVSFISVTQILSGVTPFLKKEGEILFLIKPQFELSSSELNKKGIVKSEDSYLLVEQKIKDFCHNSQIEVLDYFSSKFPGRDGNKEFFLYGKVQ